MSREPKIQVGEVGTSLSIQDRYEANAPIRFLSKTSQHTHLKILNLMISSSSFRVLRLVRASTNDLNSEMRTHHDVRSSRSPTQTFRNRYTSQFFYPSPPHHTRPLAYFHISVPTQLVVRISEERSKVMRMRMTKRMKMLYDTWKGVSSPLE